MSLSGKSGKTATRGQKQIYEENQTVILHYSIAAIFSSVSVSNILFVLPFYRKLLDIYDIITFSTRQTIIQFNESSTAVYDF